MNHVHRINRHHLFRYTLVVTILLLYSITIQAQSTPHAFGDWDIYNATPEGTQMQLFADRLYIVNTTALSSIDLNLDPDSEESYSRRTGLSGTSVQYILASDEAGKMAITYHDGLIDLIDSLGHIQCIPDLASKPMSGDKTIYSLRESHGMLYVAGGFGVLVIDMREGMVIQHYFTSYPIDFAFALNGDLYRYSAKKRLECLKAGLNGSDPRNWTTRPDVPALRDALVFPTSTGADKVNVNNNDACYVVTADGSVLNFLTLQPVCPAHNYRRIFRLHNQLLFQGDVLTLHQYPSLCTNNGYHPYQDCVDYAAANDSMCYMMHPYYGLFTAQHVNYRPGATWGLESDFDTAVLPAGIATSYLGEMHLTDQGLMGISRRSYVNGYQAANALGGVITRIDTERDEIQNTRAYQVIPMLPEGMNFQGLSGFDIDPTNPDRFAISSGLCGLYLFEGDSITAAYDGKNSVGKVDAFDPTFGSTRVSSVAYDDDGNLFFANSMQDTLLRCLTTDGRWLKFPNPGMTQLQEARRILITRHSDNHFKWVLNDCFYRKSRVGIYDDNGTLTLQSDDHTTYFATLVDQDNNTWEPDYIYDLREDLDGKIWVLTNLGPFVIEDPAACFKFAQSHVGQGKVRRVKIPRNDGTNLADYLMEATQCSCMVIDNFNRKWIGTYGAGLYLMSADCITEIFHFDTDNSPLLSNSILDLCYDATSGKVYISCEGGVLSYQTDAIEGAADYSEIYCYPNPVRPEFSGELRIMGLMNDSQVSITTTNGDLIYRTRSQGYTATWNLHTADGSRVEPGVYLIHGVDSQGKQGCVCRFLVL